LGGGNAVLKEKKVGGGVIALKTKTRKPYSGSGGTKAQFKKAQGANTISLKSFERGKQLGYAKKKKGEP